MNVKLIAPLPIRRLRAAMELKALTLKDVVDAAGVNYTTASATLTGRHHNPQTLAKLKKVIKAAPMPEEVAA